MLGKGANISEAQFIHGRHRRKCGRYKCEGLCELPEEICSYAFKSYVNREGNGYMDRSQQRSQQVSSTDTEGLNLERRKDHIVVCLEQKSSDEELCLKYQAEPER